MTLGSKIIKPYFNPFENNMIILNESLVLCYLYLLIGLTDVMPDDDDTNNVPRRETTAWILLGLVFVSVAVNLVKTSVMLYKGWKMKRTKKRCCFSCW